LERVMSIEEEKATYRIYLNLSSPLLANHREHRLTSKLAN